MPDWLRLGRALTYRNYRLFFVGQGISLIGTWMQQLGVSWLVYDLTKSALLLGIVGFAGQIPTFLLAPIAGVMSDHWNRHRTLLITQTIAMFQATALVVLMLTVDVQVWQIILLSVVMGVVNAFDVPTRQAFLVDMVPDRQSLPNAIALNSSLVNSARLIGPFLAGVTIAAGGAITCFVVNAVSYVAVLWALAAMRDFPLRPPKHRQPMWHSLSEGFLYAYRFRPIRTLLLLIALVSMMGMSQSVLLPVFANKILGGGPTMFGLLSGASGCGALVAALYLAARNSVLGLGNRITLATAALGVGIISFGLSRSLPLSLCLLVVTGFSLMFQLAACNTLLQTIVDEDKRGRVMSLYAMAFFGTAPLGSLLAGAVADRFSAPGALVFSGTMCLVGAVMFGWSLPRLREDVRPIYRRAGILPGDPAAPPVVPG